MGQEPQRRDEEVMSAPPPNASPHLCRVIYLCRSLCEAVQASCAPIMACYGYPWPAILHCGRFPTGNGLCVAAVSNGSRLGRALPRAAAGTASCRTPRPTRFWTRSVPVTLQ
ncbi:frizzled-9-like [Crocuta crocuta]